MREAIARFWTERGERERAVIAFASIVTALVLAYAYVWLPVARERDRLLVRVPELRAEARAMERDARALENLKGATRSVGLKAAIEAATGASKLVDAAPEVIEQDSTKARVTIVSVRSEQAFNWLARVQSAQGVRLESIRVTSFGDGDRVKIEATLITPR